MSNTVNITLMEDQAAKTLEVRKLKADLAAAKKDLAELDRQVLEEFEASGVPKVATRFGTVYPIHTLRVSAVNIEDPLTGEPAGKDYQRSNEALRAHGYGDYVQERFNSQSVGALIRELDDSPDGIPEDLRENLTITEVLTVGFRKS